MLLPMHMSERAILTDRSKEGMDLFNAGLGAKRSRKIRLAVMDIKSKVNH
jgi:hypothetical protein